MIIHEFEKSLKYEQSKFTTNNRFYFDKLGATKIERIEFINEEEKQLQRKDIDLYITKGGKRISVSEKDRRVNFNDIIIEFYSVYHKKIRGWMDYSEAEYLAYFVPVKVVWINKKQLVEFYKNELKPAVPDQFFDELKSCNKIKSTKNITIRAEKENITLVAAYNPTYITMNVCLGFDLLTKLSIDYEVFPFK
ncbi:MAG: hypothetical protein WCK78_04555 [Paludibacter sp.]